MRKGLRTMGWVLLTAAATYVVAEWSVLYKSGLHDLRAAEPVEVLSVPVEPERLALLAQVETMTETFREYRAAKDKQIEALTRLIANLERQIQVLTAQRVPEQQVAAVRAASTPVRWKTDSMSERVHSLVRLAGEAGFTHVEVRR